MNSGLIDSIVAEVLVQGDTWGEQTERRAGFRYHFMLGFACISRDYTVWVLVVRALGRLVDLEAHAV